MTAGERDAPVPPRPPIALTIAGTDPSGGAGVQADLKSFTALGAYGTSVITALVAQNTHGVSRVYGIDEDFVADQLAAVLTDMPVDATKTGMLGTRGLVELVVDHRTRHDFGFLVVDPVMVATSGHRLLDADAVGSVRELLMPTADLITPNLPEAALLLGDEVAPATSVAGMRDQARELVARGAGVVVLKGGHLDSGELVDLLAYADGSETVFVEYAHPKLRTANTHGTGCTLSAAITALMARERHAAPLARSELATVERCVEGGLDYLAEALASAADWQLSLDPAGAHGPVDHMHAIRTGRSVVSDDDTASDDGSASDDDIAGGRA